MGYVFSFQSVRKNENSVNVCKIVLKCKMYVWTETIWRPLILSVEATNVKVSLLMMSRIG